MLLQVTVPEGLQAGDTMMVGHHGQEFAITVPEGVQGGCLLDVDLPIDDSCAGVTSLPSLPSPSSVIVVVPDGCYEGDEFTVSFNSKEFNICVPGGCQGGDEIEVEVPEAEDEEESPLRKSPRHTREEAPPVLPPESPEELVDMRAMVCGLVSNGLLNSRKGTLVSYDASSGLYRLAIDKMYPHVFIRRENLLPLPWEEEPDDSNNEEPLQAPPAGVHYVGDRVNVERSNGRTSLATVVEYDEGFETFTVDVGNGVLKYGVEESYITPHETSNDWVGQPQRVHGVWQGFFAGRRVRISRTLARSDDDDDRDGAVVGFEARSGKYVVEMDSGVVRNDVPFGEIKVPYRMRGAAY
jgi:hypothetical protein